MAQTVTPYLLYSSCEDALDFLSRAFGFKENLRYTGAEGYVNHAEMSVGDGQIFLGNPGPQYRNPRQLGQETVGIYVELDEPLPGRIREDGDTEAQHEPLSICPRRLTIM